MQVPSQLSPALTESLETFRKPFQKGDFHTTVPASVLEVGGKMLPLPSDGQKTFLV